MIVHCASCGLLGLRVTDTMQVLEADSHFRARGFHMPSLHGDPLLFVDIPICTAQRIVFKADTADQNRLRQLLISQLQEERDCSAFVQWRPGNSPKEHDAIMERQIEVERDERRHIEMMGVLRLQLWIMGFGMMAATIIAAVVASLLSR